MRVNIQNLGPVQNATLDIKPLTIFVGPNGVGKTWTAYALAALFSPLGLFLYANEEEQNEDSELHKYIERIAIEVSENGNAKIDAQKFANDFIELYFNEIAGKICDEMDDILATELTSFRDLSINIILDETRDEFVKLFIASKFTSRLSAGKKKKEGLINIKDNNDPTIFIYTAIEDEDVGDIPPYIVRKFLYDFLVMQFQRIIFKDVFIFPTERTTFITFPIPVKSDSSGIDNIDLPKERLDAVERANRTWRAFSVKSFIATLISTSRKKLSDRSKVARRNSVIQNYMQLATLLETKVLGGEVVFSDSDPNIQRDILYQTGGMALELQASSSMVKELAPLVLYLRYLAESKQRIVIDEPEMNLHPEAQVKLMEFLCMLVNSGINVMFTTHSPYMIDHLANLIKAAKTNHPSQISDEFYLKDPSAFIDQEKVSVYHFQKDGSVDSILTEEGLIEWGTFADVSDYVSQLYFEI